MRRFTAIASKFIILICFLTSTFIALAQDRFTLTGFVTVGEAEPLISGTIKLVSNGDSSYTVNTNIVDGEFEFRALKKGNYAIYINDMRFDSFMQPVYIDKDVSLRIYLKEKPLSLQEVVVVGEKTGFSNQQGTIKLNVQGSIYSSISNTLDLLQKMPGVMISADKESISLFSKGEPLLYLDNQRVSLNDIKSLSIADIKSIEILDNPSAKYESAGRAVIQIFRKNRTQEGYEIQLQEIASYKRFYNNYSHVNANYKKGKIELKGNIGLNNLKPHERNGFDLSILHREINSGYLASAISKKPELIFGGGIYYQINESDYIMINANGRTLWEKYPINTDAYYAEGTRTNHIFTLNKNRQHGLSFTTSGNYLKRMIKQDATLFFGAQYASYKQNLNSEVNNDYTLDSTLNTSQTRQQSYHVNVFTTRVDVEKNINPKLKIEVGTLASLAKSKAVLNYQNYTPEYKFNSDYDYTEDNISGYTQLSGKGNKLSYNLDLRAEYTNIDGGLKSEINPLVQKQYLHLFPKASFNFQINNSKTISLNYGRGIARPTYSDASSIKTYITPFLEFSRNINLNPTLTNDISANLQMKDISFKLNYYWSKDPVYYTFSFDEKQNTLTMFPDNLDKEKGMNISLIIPLKYKIFTSTNTITTSINKIEDHAALMGKTRPSLYFSSSNTLTLPKNISMLTYFWGRTKRFEGLYERAPIFIMDWALSKKITNKLEATLAVNDIFKKMNFTDRFTINNINATGNYYLDAHEYSLAIKYTLGTFNKSNFKERKVDDNINRVR